MPHEPRIIHLLNVERQSPGYHMGGPSAPRTAQSWGGGYEIEHDWKLLAMTSKHSASVNLALISYMESKFIGAP